MRRWRKSRNCMLSHLPLDSPHICPLQYSVQKPHNVDHIYKLVTELIVASRDYRVI